MALKIDGTVWGAGANQEGSLGDGTNIGKKTFVKAIGLTGQ